MSSSDTSKTTTALLLSAHAKLREASCPQCHNQSQGCTWCLERVALLNGLMAARSSSETPAPFSQQTENALAAIIGCIGQYADELTVRRIWDVARRAALGSPVETEAHSPEDDFQHWLSYTGKRQQYEAELREEYFAKSGKSATPSAPPTLQRYHYTRKDYMVEDNDGAWVKFEDVVKSQKAGNESL